MCDDDCGPFRNCVSAGTCRCGFGTSWCGTSAGCRFTDTDRDHCGGCGMACDPGEVCVGGVCR
jgi:hypothetical protein